MPCQDNQPLQLPVAEKLEEIISLVTSCVIKAELQAATSQDSLLQQLANFIADGWPTRKVLPPDLVPYFAVKDELSYVEGLIFRGERVDIPESLRNKLVQLAHENHPGIVRTKQQLTEKYWWPCLDKHVQNAVRNCYICRFAGKSAKPVLQNQ